LIFAEVSALDAACTVIADQSVTGFVRAAIKIRTAHRTFKECEKILKGKENWSSCSSREDFASGVTFGLGAFDIVISFFPSKFVKLLEFAGFSGDRVAGTDYLMQAESMRNGFMHPWTSVLLSIYYGFLEYFYGECFCLHSFLVFFSFTFPFH